jgi:hypothetical protein
VGDQRDPCEEPRLQNLARESLVRVGMRDATQSGRRDGSQTGKLIFGIGLVTVGGLLMLDLLFDIDLWPLGSLWPMVLVGLGILNITARRTARSRRFGFFLVVLGAWLQAAELGWLEPELTWPILVIAWGILLVMSSLEGGRRLLGTSE